MPHSRASAETAGYSSGRWLANTVGFGRLFVTTSTVLSTTYRISEQAAVHAIAELDYDALHNLQTRAIAVIDLNFAPEP